MLNSTEKNGAARIACAILRPAFIAAYLSYIQLLPHAALQQKSTAHCPRKERLLLFSSRASLFHSSSVTMLLDKASSYNNFSVYLLVNDNTMYNVVVCSPEQSIVPVL